MYTAHVWFNNACCMMGPQYISSLLTTELFNIEHNVLGQIKENSQMKIFPVAGDEVGGIGKGGGSRKIIGGCLPNPTGFQYLE